MGGFKSPLLPLGISRPAPSASGGFLTPLPFYFGATTGEAAAVVEEQVTWDRFWEGEQQYAIQEDEEWLLLIARTFIEVIKCR